MVSSILPDEQPNVGFQWCSEMDPHPRNKTQIKESKLPEKTRKSRSLNASNVS
jgi:hypothetical protein